MDIIKVKLEKAKKQHDDAIKKLSEDLEKKHEELENTYWKERAAAVDAAVHEMIGRLL